MQSYLEHDAFSARLREALLRTAPDTARPAALAREFNRRYAGTPVTLHATRKWLGGEAIPAQDKLRVLADWLGVTSNGCVSAKAQHSPARMNRVWNSITS